MRLFIAIDLPRSFKEELMRIQKEVKGMSCGGRFVPQDNFHITLHFIGESDDIAGATAVVGGGGRGVCSLERTRGGGGCGKRGVRGPTAVMEVLGELDELTAMHESLESALYDRGFSRERKRFVPHITLGRSVEQDDLTALELKNSIRANASLTVQAITLFESRREKGEMVYIPLHREKL